MKSTQIIWTIAVLAASAVSQAQSPGVVGGVAPVQILTGPGRYEMVNRSQIEREQLRFSQQMQQQDQQDYQRITSESYAAYQDLYGSCRGAGYANCSGFQRLRQLSIDTMVTKSVPYVPAAEIANSISAFLQKRDLLLQKLAAVEVTNQVWNNFNSTNPDVKLTYQRGSLNLKAHADTYRNGIATMQAQANQFVYKYFNGIAAAATAANMGLEMPGTSETPAVLQAQLKAFQDQLTFNSSDRQNLQLMHYAVANHLVNFVTTNGKKLVWYTQGQDQDKKDWVESVQSKARLMKWARAALCVPMGVIGVSVPEPSRFNIDFLRRGLSENDFRVHQAVEFNEANIRKLVSSFDRVFLSVQSQAGELNNVGGLMSYVHRVNSTYTWHNQVAANLSVMKILREMMVDELDLLAGDISGCERVKSRYNAMYGNIKDPAFVPVIQKYFEGIQLGGNTDQTIRAFNDGGAVILSKGKVYLQLKQYMNQHPSASLTSSILELL